MDTMQLAMLWWKEQVSLKIVEPPSRPGARRVWQARSWPWRD